MDATLQLSDAPFSLRLKKATREVHTMAEKCAFMQGFLRGTATRESYVDYLEGMRRVYRELESGLEANADHPLVAPFYEPKVFREAAISRDLEFFGGNPLRNNPGADRSLKIYTTHLRRLSDYWPEGLIAHAYTRYMGDVSGGRVLARIVRNALGLSDTTVVGLSFYHFPELNDIDEFKRWFREKLDELAKQDPRLPDEITQETIKAFRLNLGFFEAMEGRAWIAALRQVFPRKKQSSPSGSAVSRLNRK